MAYYTDYTTIVPPVAGSGTITNATVSNVLANYMVLYAGCTLIKSATEGIASSSTNYAEVLYNDMYIRIHQANTNYGAMSVILAKTSNGTGVGSNSITLYYESSTTMAVTVRLRFYNTKTGFYITYLNTSSAYATLLYGVACERISTGATAYGVGYTPTLSATVYINDGLSTGYAMPTQSYTGVWDVDGARQVLTQVALVPSSTWIARYLMQTVYGAAAYLMAGIVQVGARVFFISQNNAPAFELNP